MTPKPPAVIALLGNAYHNDIKGNNKTKFFWLAMPLI